jgi:pimeloyl-ACP methyl ester carboxylesterase
LTRRAHKTTALLVAIAANLSFAGDARVAPPTPTAVPRETYDAPGRRVTLPGGRRLNFVCMGSGSPTVILESGFGAGAFAWGKTQPRIAAVTRVCAYDRAGYGWSDPGPMPRDGAAIARDLDWGLKAAKISGPYVLVGHSAGGLYARLFAARRRREIAGIVFVDTSIEHQSQRFAALLGPGAGTLEPLRRKAARCLEAVRDKASVAAEAETLACAGQAGPGPSDLGVRPGFWMTEVSELDTLFDATSDEVDRTGRVLGRVTVIVLTAARSDGPSPTPEQPGALVWQQFHHVLMASFAHGEQRLVKSGHLMMNERPEVVAGAAIELVEAARRP